MGFSRGGQASLFSAMKRFDKLWNKSGTSFAAYIAFYPDCSTTYKNDTAIADKPIRIFHGTADNYDPIEPCRSYVSRLKQAGHNDVTLTEYPNAPHNFDNPLGAIPAAPGKGHQSVRDCAIREGADGTLINAETGRPFSYDDQCVKLGPLLGADPEAREAARSEVTQFFKQPLGCTDLRIRRLSHQFGYAVLILVVSAFGPAAPTAEQPETAQAFSEGRSQCLVRGCSG